MRIQHACLALAVCAVAATTYAGEPVAVGERVAVAAEASGSERCLFDPADGRYKKCFHVTGDGRCAHFGSSCSGSELGREPCLFDPDDGRYKKCFHVTGDGRCAHFGPSCSAGAPGKETCLFDPKDGKLKKCFHVTVDGRCAHFGGSCSG